MGDISGLNTKLTRQRDGKRQIKRTSCINVNDFCVGCLALGDVGLLSNIMEPDDSLLGKAQKCICDCWDQGLWIILSSRVITEERCNTSQGPQRNTRLSTTTVFQIFAQVIMVLWCLWRCSFPRSMWNDHEKVLKLDYCIAAIGKLSISFICWWCCGRRQK